MDANKVKQQAMLTALEKCLGVVAMAAREAGIDRTTHYTWMHGDPEYAAAVLDLEDVTLDFAEAALHKQISNGEVSATIFLLKTKGKKRGYIERNELDVSGALGITWNEQKTYVSPEGPIQTKTGMLTTKGGDVPR